MITRNPYPVAALPTARSFDLVSSLAVPLPVQVIAEILGVETARRADFKRWSEELFARFPRLRLQGEVVRQPSLLTRGACSIPLGAG